MKSMEIGHFLEEKRPYLKLQTSKSKTVNSFEKFGKNSSIRELFGKFDAFQGLKLHAYFFFTQILQ